MSDLMQSCDSKLDEIKCSLSTLWEDHSKHVGQVEVVFNLFEKLQIRLLDCEHLIEDLQKLKRDYYAAPRWDIKPLYDRVDELENKVSEKYAHPDVIGRIERLENRHDSFTKCQHPRLLQERIDNVEKALENYREYKTSIEDLETDVMYLKKHVESMTESYLRKVITNAVPHKCPVCYGSQRNYLDSLYPISQYPEGVKLDWEGKRYQDCAVCEGKGIVWG